MCWLAYGSRKGGPKFPNVSPKGYIHLINLIVSGRLSSRCAHVSDYSIVDWLTSTVMLLVVKLFHIGAEKVISSKYNDLCLLDRNPF